MKIIDRLKFIFTYDVELQFLVFDFKGQQGMTFMKYKDAKKFSDEQLEYRPKVMVEIRKRKK